MHPAHAMAGAAAVAMLVAFISAQLGYRNVTPGVTLALVGWAGIVAGSRR